MHIRRVAKTDIRLIKHAMRSKCEGHICIYMQNRNTCIHALYVSYSQCDVYVIVTISHLYTIFPFCIYIASILNAMYMHLKQTHLYAIRPTTRYITHSKNRNWSKCDVHRILNCDIYRIYFLNAMYVASACGVL